MTDERIEPTLDRGALFELTAYLNKLTPEERAKLIKDWKHAGRAGSLIVPADATPQQEPEFWEWAAYDEEKGEWSEWARVQDAGQLFSLQNHVKHGYQYRLRPLFAGPHLKCSQMTFGEALHAMKCGEHVARDGWNGKRQFAFVMRQNANRYVFKGDETPYELAPVLALKNAQGVVQPGWVPSQGDLFADDWYVICPMVG